MKPNTTIESLKQLLEKHMINNVGTLYIKGYQEKDVMEGLSVCLNNVQNISITNRYIYASID